jgi:hypothetical protein
MTTLSKSGCCVSDIDEKPIVSLDRDGWLELFCNQAHADKLARAKLGARVEVWAPK